MLILGDAAKKSMDIVIGSIGSLLIDRISTILSTNLIPSIQNKAATQELVDMQVSIQTFSFLHAPCVYTAYRTPATVGNAATPEFITKLS